MEAGTDMDCGAQGDRSGYYTLTLVSLLREEQSWHINMVVVDNTHSAPCPNSGDLFMLCQRFGHSYAT